jgi:hypothetical protein
MASNVLTFPLGPAEAVLDGIGDELNELAGLRETRLAAVANAGATVATVETTYSWPASGAFYMAGKLYSYSGKTASSFMGLAPPVAEDLRELTPLVDWSRSYSALDLARRSVLVDYAEENYLDALGRNYGVFRFPGLTDDAFRSAIKALAFAPKGTVATIETVLTYLVGPGNFEVFEDLVNFPNEVFVTLDAALSASETEGKTFFNARETQTSLTSSTVQVQYEPVGLGIDSVLGVYLAPELHHAYFDTGPALEPETPWTYTGTEVENTVVTSNGDGSFRVRDTAGAQVGACYQRTLRATTNTDIFALATVRRVAATDNTVLQIRLADGARQITVGWNATQLFFYKTATLAQLGTPFLLDTAAHTIEIRKLGGPFGPTASVELWVDGVLRDTVAYTSFPSVVTRLVEFGSFSTTGTMDSHWSSLEIYTRDYHTNYWNQRRAADGSVLSANPARLTSAGSFFDAIFSAERPVTVRGSTAAHGRNNGRYRVVTVGPAGAYVDVVGEEHDGLEVISADTVRIPEGVYDSFTAEDAGLAATRATGAGLAGLVWRARYGGDDGNAITVTIVDPPGNDVPLTINVVGPAITVTLETDSGSAPISTAAQVKAAIEANTTAAALVEVDLAESPGSGVMAAAALGNLAGGEDGKFLNIAGAGIAGNNGSRKIATLVNARTVRLGSHIAPAVLDNADTVRARWRKDPNFSTQASLEWEVIGAGTVAGGNNLAFQRQLFAAALDVEVVYLTTRTGTILANEFERNDGDLFPFYLADPLAFVRTIIDAITVAGVIPRYR